MDESVLHQRRPLKFRAAPYLTPHPDRQFTVQSTIAPYAQFRANIAGGVRLLNLQPRELICGAKLSTGVICVRKRSGVGI